jgi:hypothetical protein
MRLQKYLNEEEEYFDYIGIIERDCKPFLSFIKVFKPIPFVYRGVKSNKTFIHKTPRSDRKPLDTPLETHKILDELFYEKFGWKVRSEGVFTFTYSGAGYGTNYYFFPIGKNFKYVYSPDVKDLFITIERMGKKSKDREELKKIVDTYYQNEKYAQAFVGVNKEIVWKCDSYYLLNQKAVPLT